MATIEIKVPDIGGIDTVPVIEVLVAVGDTVAKDQGLVTLESDKATMEVPSPAAGVVRALTVKLGDTVSEGQVIAELDVDAAAAAPPAGDTPRRPFPDDAPTRSAAFSAAAPVPPAPARADAPAAPQAASGSGRTPDITCRMLVLGAGPGGYTAAFRAADLGLDTVLVERYPSLGGVCPAVCACWTMAAARSLGTPRATIMRRRNSSSRAGSLGRGCQLVVDLSREVYTSSMPRWLTKISVPPPAFFSRRVRYRSS